MVFASITLVVRQVPYGYLHTTHGGFYLDGFGLTLIISGGLGNFIDRMSQGFVVDMFHLDFINFAIFNVADSHLTVGVIVLLIAMLKEGSKWKLKLKEGGLRFRQGSVRFDRNCHAVSLMNKSK